jgi:phage terminase large subunit-like protein
MHTLLWGGSRSAKTTILVRNVILRAIKKPSKHLLVRHHFNHAKASLAHETIPFVLENCFPELESEENKTDSYYTFPTNCGNTSEVWLAGTDDHIRAERILGNEFSSVFFNECSQIPWEVMPTFHTRVAENSGLKLRYYYDCNPPSRKHWTHKVFMENIYPDGSSCKLDTAHLQMNPIHNEENLPEAYLESLRNLPPRARQRFYDGLFLDDLEGALWNQEMVSKAKERNSFDPDRIIVAVDPAVTNNPNSDETGIVVCGTTADSQLGMVLADVSLKASPEQWAQAAVSAYEKYNANLIVAETNNGGDLVINIIRNLNPRIKVVKVHAAVSKVARAEPISQLYEQDKITHAEGLELLEEELLGWVPGTGPSPNRLDALVWGLSQLMLKKPTARFHCG